MLNRSYSATSQDVCRRQFLKSSAAAALGPVASRHQDDPARKLHSSFDELKLLGARVKPVASGEYQARIAHAQQLLAEQKPEPNASSLLLGPRSTTSRACIGGPASA
jgi:hypothetical protein